MTQLTPHEEDPVVHGLLANLEQFSPSPGFSDRVMSQVWRPAPSWVHRVRHTCSTAFSRQRVWVTLGTWAAASAVTLVGVATAAIVYSVQIETAWSVMMNMAVGLWRISVQTTAGFVVFASRLIEPATLNQSTFVAFVLSTLLVLGLSGLGLQHTIRLYRNERTALHARG